NWSGCSSMQTNQVTALTDTRDGNTYAVAKFADGKCWMMENLRLDLADANTTINASNTNNPTSTFLTERTAVVGTSSPRNDCYASNGAQCVNQISFDNARIDGSLTPSPYAGDSAWLSGGVAYNWYTATAGNGIYATTKVDVLAGDICPSGWHVPTGVVNGDMYGLMSSIGSVTKNQYGGLYYELESDLGAFPNNFVKITTRQWRNTNTDGAYYLSTAINKSQASEVVFMRFVYISYDQIDGKVYMVDVDEYANAPDKSVTLPIRCLVN
ncbi:hypothetical protein IK146_02140, partial [Candidatus Saccharibacteria bacterium]|nr:hypothetical protein [Candidatus Saccharibacteria bacterium]